MTTPVEDTLADRFRAEAATVSAPADTAAVAAVGRRSSALRSRRRARAGAGRHRRPRRRRRRGGGRGPAPRERG